MNPVATAPAPPGAPAIDDHAPPGPQSAAPGPEYAWLPGPARAALSTLAGAAFALALPDPGYWPLAPLALAAFFALFVTASPRRAFREGFVAGFAWYALTVRWFAAVLLVHTGLGGFVAGLAVFLVGVLNGLAVGLFAGVLARFARRFGGGAALAVAAPAWIGLETMRLTFPFPFPWGTLAATWARVPGIPPVTTMAGTAGLSLLLAVGAALLAALLVARTGARRRIALGGLAVWAGLLLACARGGAHWLDTSAPRAAPVRVAALQASLRVEADPLDELAVYEALTVQAARRGAQIVVWPESAVSIRIDKNDGYRGYVEALARRLSVDILLGSVTAAPGGGYYNSDVLVRADTGLSSLQPKQQLVPFGEYLPARPLFGSIPALAWELGEDFKPGPGPVPLVAREGSIGALVCFESVFPDLARALAAEGAGILVNTTNDTWFGWTSGAWQHLQHGLLRAAETGRPIVRAAHGGVSALVTRRGEVVAQLGLGERGVLVADLEPGTRPTPGMTAGKVLSAACATVAALLLGFAVVFLRPPRAPRAVPPATPAPPAADAIDADGPTAPEDTERENAKDDPDA